MYTGQEINSVILEKEIVSSMYAISSLCTLAHIRDHVYFPADFGPFTICGDKVVVVKIANSNCCIMRHCFVLSDYNKQNPWEYDCSDVYMI